MYSSSQSPQLFSQQYNNREEKSMYFDLRRSNGLEVWAFISN